MEFYSKNMHWTLSGNTTTQLAIAKQIYYGNMDYLEATLKYSRREEINITVESVPMLSVPTLIATYQIYQTDTGTFTSYRFMAENDFQLVDLMQTITCRYGSSRVASTSPRVLTTHTVESVAEQLNILVKIIAFRQKAECIHCFNTRHEMLVVLPHQIIVHQYRLDEIIGPSALNVSQLELSETVPRQFTQHIVDTCENNRWPCAVSVDYPPTVKEYVETFGTIPNLKNLITYGAIL